MFIKSFVEEKNNHFNSYAIILTIKTSAVASSKAICRLLREACIDYRPLRSFPCM